ncbi:MAG: SDR family oxidoreductase [Spirochaetales bacterium]|nr:SDR family oxidoreductase [Spirochaetales bacterium]
MSRTAESDLGSAFDLSGERVLITGGGTGLGFGMARCFLAAGAAVVVAGRREPVLREAARRLGDRADYRVYDVTAAAQAQQFISSLEEELGPVTILVNNAGIHHRKSLEETGIEEFRLVWDTHVLGGLALSRAAAPGMKDAGRGSILFMASMASYFGIAYTTAYSAAKTGLLGVVRVLSSELAPAGIRVNAIAPGWIDAGMGRAPDPERRKQIIARTPLGRYGEAEDVGWAAVYLCSPAARFVTGICLPVDGGVSSAF